MTQNTFQNAVDKSKKLEEVFRALPETIITGVVGANGPGGGRMPSDKYWSLNLSLIAWRDSEGNIYNSNLIIYKYLTDFELEQIQKKVKEESLVRLKAKVSKNSPFGDARAELIDVMDTPDDDELKLILAKFKEPTVVEHPLFGSFTLDKSVDWFEGKIEWLNSSIKANVTIDDNGSPDLGFATLESLYKNANTWSKRIIEYAVSELLDLKNYFWLLEDQDEISASDFVGAMKLESITVYPDGDFEFWHNDGDLFWGHSILISGSLIGGPNSADIPG